MTERQWEGISFLVLIVFLLGSQFYAIADGDLVFACAFEVLLCGLCYGAGRFARG